MKIRRGLRFTLLNLKIKKKLGVPGTQQQQQ